MLIYKQRYKPRTTREFTKSDLTVYDSADNTALNALTVYGKSEVVDGSIKSAGEGYSVVDLGTLDYVSDLDIGQYGRFYTPSLANVIQKVNGSLLCSIFNQAIALTDVTSHESGYMFLSELGNISFSKNGHETNTAFKAAMSGVILAYKEATPTNNTIAIKTDDGTGVNGTMAVFTTGTPLRGIPDSDIRDVMTWDGSAGTFAKNCGEVDLGTLGWTMNNTSQFFALLSPYGVSDGSGANLICSKYTGGNAYSSSTADKVICIYGTNHYVWVKDSDYTDATAFKTAMNGVKLVYEIATPTYEQLTTAENDSIAALRTFEPQTHAQNNAGAEMTVDYTIRVPAI